MKINIKKQWAVQYFKDLLPWFIHTSDSLDIDAGFVGIFLSSFFQKLEKNLAEQINCKLCIHIVFGEICKTFDFEIKRSKVKVTEGTNV